MIKLLITIDNTLLKKQIDALLLSNMDEDTKEGLHNLLSEINLQTEYGKSTTLKGDGADK